MSRRDGPRPGTIDDEVVITRRHTRQYAFGRPIPAREEVESTSEVVRGRSVLDDDGGCGVGVRRVDVDAQPPPVVADMEVLGLELPSTIERLLLPVRACAR